MLQKCPKSCDACPAVSLFENQININEDGITTFNVSLNVNTDSYANETSWTFLAQSRNDSIIFNSSESNATSELENNAEYKFNYYCTVHPTEENQLNDETTKSTCYDFEVHDSYGNGMCCEYGDGFFSMNIDTSSSALKIKDEFQDGSVINTSFCIGHDDGEIRSNGRFITTKQLSHYPFRWQCKNSVCLCDSKPSLTTNIHENHVFLFQISMLSDSDKLRDLDSAQYKAACWVLYDDPYEYDLVDGETHNRRIQRYILAVFYFSTSPEKWKKHSDFLSSRSECDWKHYGSRGISCNEEDNVSEINLAMNNLEGTIVEELSVLRMLENQRLASCSEIEVICGKEEQPITLKPNTTERIMYNQAIQISSKEIVNDPSSSQSKALCWMLNNNHYDNKIDISDTDIIQRYVLAILHFLSPYRLFGDDEQLAKKHECDWSGITCKGNNTQIVTEISLFSENNQIINGTLIDEIGSLKYLEVLELNQTKLHGTISRSFSNLWSLVKLDLSGNKISSTIPATLFHQLNNLDYIDLSDNKLSGSINSNIGSFSHIRFLSTRNNSLTGSLPLDSFKHYDLEHLDISGNALSQINFSPLLMHKNLKFLDISSNFFVGSLLDSTFTSLTQLSYFNASQNDISGTIPSTFPKLSNISHFDLHANKLRGTIPSGIKELRNIQHLNLQGNKLTGSLSSEINQLQNLTILVLSHNELKGSIPFNQNNLQKLERLHLQNNKLEGEAPSFNNISSYITDCGFPSDSLDKVTCSSCSACCNSDGGCQSKSSEELSQVYKTLIFMFSIIGFTSMCYLMKDYITSNIFLKSFFLETVSFSNAMMLISDKSVYHFLLAKNKTEWFVAVCCVVFQTATLLLFVKSADMSSDTSDREYFMICPSNSLECKNSNTVSPYGRFIFGIILTVWLLKDVIGSMKLMLVSFQKRSIDFFFASAMLFTVTTVSIWTSAIYIVAIAGKNTDMIKDAVVLLFVVEVDERIFQLVESINPDWIRTINNNMRQSLVYRGDDLVISSSIMKFVELSKSMRQKIREIGELFRKRNIQGSGKTEVNKDKEEGEETHTDAVGVESNP